MEETQRKDRRGQGKEQCCWLVLKRHISLELLFKFPTKLLKIRQGNWSLYRTVFRCLISPIFDGFMEALWRSVENKVYPYEVWRVCSVSRNEPCLEDGLSGAVRMHMLILFIFPWIFVTWTRQSLSGTAELWHSTAEWQWDQSSLQMITGVPKRQVTLNDAWHCSTQLKMGCSSDRPQ
jgi:hypothetical protein